MQNDDRYTIEILDKALDVVEALAESEGNAQSPGELARRLNINRSRTYRILKTFERRGYVEVDEQAQGFRLGLRFIPLGEYVRKSVDLDKKAAPILMELAETTGDAANLLVRYENSAICIDHYLGSYSLQVIANLDKPIPLYIGASPKILLAWLPEAERDEIIESLELFPYTAKTITDKGVLRKRLDQIRKRGYEIDEGDFEVGVMAVGAPVFDFSGKVVAGLTVTTPEARYTRAREGKILEAVVRAAQNLSKGLGYFPTKAPVAVREAVKNKG
jgi:IclR family KDG regulon transcriptional repressor